MVGKPIQEQFGEQVIEAFAEFARADLGSVASLEANEFSHISNRSLKRSLAEVFYGARWIYKLGLALLTRDEERAAHVRAQIVDYAAIAEALLSDCIIHAIVNGHAQGTAYCWADPDKMQQPLAWSRSNPKYIVSRQSLWWLVRVAREFAIVDSRLADDLQWLREQRNTVHLMHRSSLGPTAYLSQSKRAFTATSSTIKQTKAWKAVHP